MSFGDERDERDEDGAATEPAPRPSAEQKIAEFFPEPAPAARDSYRPRRRGERS